MGPSTFEMEIDALVLANIAWSRLRELMDGEIGRNDVEPECIDEAQVLLQLQKAVAIKSDFVMIRLRHKD